MAKHAGRPVGVNHHHAISWKPKPSTLLSLLAKVLGRPGPKGNLTLLSLLAKVLRGPGEPGRSTLLSLLGPGEEGRSTLLSLLATGLGGPADDDVVAAHAQCKVEASEHTGFERHGSADTLS